MQIDYTEGLRALEEIILAKARMDLDHSGLPRHSVDHMIKKAIHHGRHHGHVSKKAFKKIVKRMKKRVIRIAKKSH